MSFDYLRGGDVLCPQRQATSNLYDPASTDVPVNFGERGPSIVATAGEDDVLAVDGRTIRCQVILVRFSLCSGQSAEDGWPGRDNGARYRTGFKLPEQPLASQ